MGYTGAPEDRPNCLSDLALIVRCADTARLDLAPQAAGLLAISLGLSHLVEADHEMLRQGMVVYDALYAWCRHARDERHGWNPDDLRVAPPRASA